MYSRPRLALHYLQHFLTASNGKGHGTHSPFVYDFIANVLNDQQHYPEYDPVEDLRNELSKDQQLLNIKDLGAGSTLNNTEQRTIASIARHAAKPKKFGQLLFRMVKKYQPKTILELGTSLGISSAYLATANPSAKLVTLEGADEVAAIAVQNFKKLNISNCRLIKGSFDDNLERAIKDLSALDFTFVDGNHRREPTEKYFRQLLSGAHPGSIFIFDDIHWSSGMEEAWKNIQQDPAVRCSIDLFFIGIVLFRTEFHEKQHFRIRF